MKNLTATLLFLFLFSIIGYSQKPSSKIKDTTIQVAYDTVYAGYRANIQLDSAQYKYVMDFVSSFPIGDERVQTVYTLLKGGLKNIQFQPLYGLKIRQKK